MYYLVVLGKVIGTYEGEYDLLEGEAVIQYYNVKFNDLGKKFFKATKFPFDFVASTLSIDFNSGEVATYEGHDPSIHIVDWSVFNKDAV